MRFPGNSLRINILAQMAFLIVAAMLLISIVMLKFQEHEFIQGKLKQGKLLTQAIGQEFTDEWIHESRKGDSRVTPTMQRQAVLRLIQTAGFSGAVILDRQGTVVDTYGHSDREQGESFAQARQALVTGRGEVQFAGQMWGVLWLAYQKVIISAPLMQNNRVLGSLAVWGDLGNVYQRIRTSEKLVLIYILLNTLVLISVGLYLLSRSVVNPVHKLLQITEAFRKGESIPLLPDTSENEMGQLNRSLNLMLKRLDENKEELQAHISSLEKANEGIKRAQEELIRSEKLASVGRLATGIAHEIGNPMGIILGYMDLLKRGDLTREEREDFLDRVEVEITRINGIIRQLLDFSRPASGKPRETGIHQLIRGTLQMLKPQPLMADIQPKIVFDALEDVVWGDPDQLQQVFLNIMMNAADAMSSVPSDKQRLGKLLTISTRNMGDDIRIRFEDTGPGIPEECIDKLFDPFFTTKPPGKGTGLGLSVSYNIIRGLGGSIRAENNRGTGAAIVIDIPLHRAEEVRSTSD